MELITAVTAIETQAQAQAQPQLPIQAQPQLPIQPQSHELERLCGLSLRRSSFFLGKNLRLGMPKLFSLPDHSIKLHSFTKKHLLNRNYFFILPYLPIFVKW